MPDDRREPVVESAARRAVAFDTAPDPVIVIDHHGQVVEFNRRAEVVFGYRREDALRRRLVELIVPARSRQRMLARLVRFQATGNSPLLGRRLQGFAVKSDGSEFPVEFVATRISHEGPPEFAIYLSDNTLRRQADDELARYQGQLRSLAAELLLSEERERRRLAIDLHDGLSQTIALVQMKLASLRCPANPALEAKLEDIRALVLDADRSTRSITFELTPPILHDLGLEPAVEWLIENIQARYGIEIGFEDDGQPKPADERVRVILFRAIRELLINAAKHALATRIRVRLARERDLVNAAVEDNGVGMDPNAAIVSGSGLFSIRERMRYVGGSLNIESTQGRGTRVCLRAPLANRESTAAEITA